MHKQRVQPSGRGSRASVNSLTPLRHDSEYISVRFKGEEENHVVADFQHLASTCSHRSSHPIRQRLHVVHLVGAASARSAKNPTETLRVFPSSLIEGYLGDGFIRDSPLVQDVLAGDTTPRDYALFLESDTKTSTQNCSDMPLFDAAIYTYDFLSEGYLKMVSGTKYNVSTFRDLELVVVVVDCSFRLIVVGDPSSVRVYNLVRSIEDPSHLYLVTMSLNVIDCRPRTSWHPGNYLVVAR
ncbi:hypothetical protein PF008_g4057 [Phytophthora fragariae]|uniref:Uncharacterized protein n=1 Tax=Phytophthora fragariae TaxID=53985 RepID=A0A6G0SCD6_9STRA|nr:hypothetical protein PF008_g4057 [Phytophthora fragariae]